MKQEKYKEALRLFDELGIYKDSPKQINNIRKIEFSSKNIGDTIVFGYDEEDIEWMILDKQKNKMLVISKYVLDDQPYNERYETTTWENCSLRSFLNLDYINYLFDEYEQEIIIESKLINDDNEKEGTEGGNDTKDKIFLLSVKEANKYFVSDEKRIAYNKNGDACYWWLRSPGYYGQHASGVCSDGHIDSESSAWFETDVMCVRPAMWIDLK